MSRFVTLSGPDLELYQSPGVLMDSRLGPFLLILALGVARTGSRGVIRRARMGPQFGLPLAARRYQCSACGAEATQTTNHTDSIYVRCLQCSWKGVEMPDGTRLGPGTRPHVFLG
jgi:DNA-directed RNA polymerase subunit RPC12/RpoP